MTLGQTDRFRDRQTNRRREANPFTRSYDSRGPDVSDQPPLTGPFRMLVHGWFELAPNAGPGRLGNSGFIRGSAGRGCRAADEARSAFCRRGSYADERRYSLYAKPRIFAELRRGSGTSWRSGTLNGTCR